MPSSKIILLLGSTILAVGLVYISINGLKPQTYVADTNTSTTLAVDTVLKQSSNEDRDQDSLKDWEEVLWQTDPNNPDTDGDGVSDGEEVSEGRSPTTKGAGAGAQTVVAVPGNTSVNLNETETEKFARTFFEQYLTLKQKNDGVKLDPLDEEKLISELIAKPNTFQAKTYTKTDLLISSESVSGDRVAVLKTYGNSVGRTFKNNPLPVNQEHEIDIFQNALSKERSQDLAKLSPIIDNYKETVNDLLLIRIPSDVSALHLELINSMSAVSGSIESMRSFYEDPVKALGGISLYSANVVRMKKAFVALQTFFSANKVTFQQADDGSIVVQPL